MMIVRRCNLAKSARLHEGSSHPPCVLRYKRRCDPVSFPQRVLLAPHCPSLRPTVHRPPLIPLFLNHHPLLLQWPASPLFSLRSLLSSARLPRRPFPSRVLKSVPVLDRVHGTTLVSVLADGPTRTVTRSLLSRPPSTAVAHTAARPSTSRTRRTARLPPPRSPTSAPAAAMEAWT